MLMDVVRRVETRLSAVGLSATAASRMAGLSEDAIRNMRRAVQNGRDRKGVSTRTLSALAPVLMTTSGWLLEGVGPEEVAGGQRAMTLPVRLLARLEAPPDAAGPGRTITVSELPPGEWTALEVAGSAMDRIAPEGAIICVNRAETALVQDRFYVFTRDGGGSLFRRYKADPDRFAPYSYDPDAEVIRPEGAWSVFGRVRRVIRDLD